MTSRLFGAPLLAAFALLAACGEAATAPDRTPTFSAILAGRPWGGQASATLVVDAARGDTLFLHGYAPTDGTRPEVAVRFRLAPFTGPGRYPLRPGDVRLDELVGGDVLVASYADAPTGAVEVRAYDGPGGTVAGAAEFTAGRSGERGSFGAVVRLEAGEFRAQAVRCCPVAQGAAGPPR
jgi:hypothetical protein